MLNRGVLATDIKPWAVRMAMENAALNGVAHLVTARPADRWRDPFVQGGGRYSLVFANILARPLCRMTRG
jgi:ribosomal protein L11 methyltransferase